MSDRLKVYAALFVAGLLFLGGLAIGYEIADKPGPPIGPAASASTEAASKAEKDKSNIKKAGVIIRYLPSKCDGKPQEIAEIEKFDSEVQNDIDSKSKTASTAESVAYQPDNFMGVTDLKSAGEVLYRPFDKFPLWTGGEYNLPRSEAVFKLGFSTRVNL